ncbi:hypothetical protein ZHAS_00018944 [Anopheles sinensis]|uniref:Fibrinogen C-terminal domain-containing protein n=1 Tax=Anopheles sinensis TaxID=74873 RepID=A0A084WJZ9_ANOSI|nr:hypothetical protein ZHAS_00018944 [Anopheles sinensis]
MPFKSGLLCVLLCIYVSSEWTPAVQAQTDMPTVMAAFVNVMIDFRRQILDNLQLSLEYHTEQLEEVKIYTEHKLNEQEKRITAKMEKLNQNLQTIKMGKQPLDLQSDSRAYPTSCDNIGFISNDAFPIRPLDIEEPFYVLCHVENVFNLGGRWTVFQRRIDGSVNFFRDWQTYKNGFGDVSGEHWLGLEKLHLMTRSGRHELLVLLEDYDGNSTYALYDEFKIGSEANKYKLTVGKHSGTAYDSLSEHNGMKFTTIDQDNDVHATNNCAKLNQGGWWYTGCKQRFV